ncbi:MAG: hypothetical protein ACI4AK_09340 [Lepagella sp.]
MASRPSCEADACMVIDHRVRLYSVRHWLTPIKAHPDAPTGSADVIITEGRGVGNLSSADRLRH